MSYIINVATKAKQSMPPRHVFRTAEDSILSHDKAIEVARQLRTAYPSGVYTIDISRWDCSGTDIPWED